MNKNGLYSEPRFEDTEYYLGEGELTRQTDFIKFIASKIDGKTDGRKVRNLMVWINNNIPRIKGEKDVRKFKKTAEEIITEKRRTGCSDSAIVFSTIARAMGIPTMQVISFDQDWGKAVEKGDETDGTYGHFYCGVYIKDNEGNANWILVDSDQQVAGPDQVEFRRLDKKDRLLSGIRVAFAYVRDFRDVSVDGVKIDSSSNMRYIQEKAAKEFYRSKSGMEK